MTLQEIKTIVCEAFGIEECDFVITTRQEQFAYPRFAYYVLCRKLTNKSHEDIGKTVLRVHTTVMNGIMRHDSLMATKRDYAFNFKKAETAVKKLKESSNETTRT